MKRSNRISLLLSGAALAALVGLPVAAPAATSSKVLLSCQKALEKNAQSLGTYAIGKVTSCTERVARCKLAAEIDAEDLPSCLATTAATCGGTPTKVSDQQTSRRDKTLVKCGLVPLADLEPFVGGLGFFNVVGACGAATANDLVSCVLADARCNAERTVFRFDPRSQDSLTTAGVAGSFPCVAP